MSVFIMIDHEFKLLQKAIEDMREVRNSTILLMDCRSYWDKRIEELM